MLKLPDSHVENVAYLLGAEKRDKANQQGKSTNIVAMVSVHCR